MTGLARDRLTGLLLRQRDGDHLRRRLRLFRPQRRRTSSAPRTSLNIVKQASFVGVIAVGMTFVLLTAGIDLSVGSNMYVSAMTVGYLLQSRACRAASASLPGIVVGLATGAAFGAVNAFCIVFLRITPFLVTLATMVAGHGLVTAITESFGIDYPAGLHCLRRCVDRSACRFPSSSSRSWSQRRTWC